VKRAHSCRAERLGELGNLGILTELRHSVWVEPGAASAAVRRGFKV
jgi:hypothetical protein